MKLKKSYVHIGDDSIMATAVIEDTQGEGMERRARRGYYGFGTLREELEISNPNMTEDVMLALWKRRVERSTDKIEENGEVMIARAAVVLMDDVHSNMHYNRLTKEKQVESADALAKVQKEFEQAAHTARVSMLNLVPRRPPTDLPLEAQNVDGLTGQVCYQASLSKSVLAGTLARDLVKQKQSWEVFEQDQIWRRSR
jgi:hypothetical protein